MFYGPLSNICTFICTFMNLKKKKNLLFQKQYCSPRFLAFYNPLKFRLQGNKIVMKGA